MIDDWPRSCYYGVIHAAIPLKWKEHMVTHDLQFTRDPAIVMRRIGDEVVLVPVRSASGAMGEIFALNDPAALIWQALAQPQTTHDLCALVVAEYEVEPAEAQRDVAELLGQFVEAALVREVR